MQKVWPKSISRICNLGQNSPIFEFDNPTEAKNEFGITKKISPRPLAPLGAGREFGPPRLKKIDFGDAEISAKLHLWV